jgi:hypothetical protein
VLYDSNGEESSMMSPDAAWGATVFASSASSEEVGIEDGNREGKGQAYAILATSSTWLHSATNRSKNSCEPPAIISICIVPLRLKVPRLRMMSAR